MAYHLYILQAIDFSWSKREISGPEQYIFIYTVYAGVWFILCSFKTKLQQQQQ